MTELKDSFTPALALGLLGLMGVAPKFAQEQILQLMASKTTAVMTNVPGLYAFGEVNFAYHGANRLGANALLSCIFDGLFCGVSVANYVRDGAPGKAPAEGMPSAAFDAAAAAEKAKMDRLIGTVGQGTGDNSFNPYAIGKELGEEMTAGCTVVRSAPRLAQCLNKIHELKERFSKATLSDSAAWTNQSFSYSRAVGDMVLIAEAMVKAADLRKESRGAHYRTDFPTRNDDEFMKSTVAKFDPASRSSSVDLHDIDHALILPEARTYGKKS
jgi:succinate dehydrogenase / fumarate reductase flavoprotein subunit